MDTEQGRCKLKCQPRRWQISPPCPKLQLEQLSRKFVTISNMNFLDTVMEIVVGSQILKNYIYVTA
jgi:hypothetical protein